MKGSEQTNMNQKAERPKTLRKLRSVYEPMETNKGLDKILSPFDEQEEWAKITEMMASFHPGNMRESILVSELEKEFQTRLGVNLSEPEKKHIFVPTTPIGFWLQLFKQEEFEEPFINYGYDDINFINGVLNDEDLQEMGVEKEEDRILILNESKKLPEKVKEAYTESKAVEQDNSDNETSQNETNIGMKCCTLEEWLERLQLSTYLESFKKGYFGTMEKARKVWEIELVALVEITIPGHRRRMLASLPQHSSPEFSIDDLYSDYIIVKNAIRELESKSKSSFTAPQVQSSTQATTQNSMNQTGTLRHSHKKNRPAPPPPSKPTVPADQSQPELRIRDPSELMVGFPSTLTTQWRHRPTALVTGHITYHAQYLGSTIVKVLKGTESTKESIQKLKKPLNDSKDTPDIFLAISYRGVKFLSPENQELICEHTIRNIHCACQDSDDLTHFAYITKDHTSKTHYCHVFCVHTMDQATEVILTLGEAFEVAYQMALKEELGACGRGHIRSQSVNQIVTHSQNTHNRSHSVNEIKLNGKSLQESELHNGHPPTPPAPPKQPIVMTEEI